MRAPSFEVVKLHTPSYLVRVEDADGKNICCFNVTVEMDATLVVQGLRGTVPSAAQWRSAMAEYFPSAKYVRFERGSAFLGNIKERKIRVR